MLYCAHDGLERTDQGPRAHRSRRRVRGRAPLRARTGLARLVLERASRPRPQTGPFGGPGRRHLRRPRPRIENLRAWRGSVAAAPGGRRSACAARDGAERRPRGNRVAARGPGVAAAPPTPESVRQIEVVEIAVAAGGGAEAAEERAVGALAFRRDWLESRGLDPTRCVVIGVRGASMEPTLPDGARILIDRTARRRRAGRLYALAHRRRTRRQARRQGRRRLVAAERQPGARIRASPVARRRCDPRRGAMDGADFRMTAPRNADERLVTGGVSGLWWRTARRRPSACRPGDPAAPGAAGGWFQS